MIYGATMLFSFYMGMVYGILGIFASYWWVYILVLREYLRERKLIRLGLVRSEAFEGGTAGSKAALNRYLALLKVDKEKPPSPSPIQH